MENLGAPACTGSGTCISGPCMSGSSGGGGGGGGSSGGSARKRNVLILVLIVGGALLLLAALGVGGLFAIRAYRRCLRSGTGGAYNETRSSYQLM